MRLIIDEVELHSRFHEGGTMATYMVGYDLNKKGQNYPSLIAAIKSYGTFWSCLDSTWLIVTTESAEEIREHLQRFIDANDELLVAALTGEASWIGFTTDCSNWIEEHL